MTEQKKHVIMVGDGRFNSNSAAMRQLMQALGDNIQNVEVIHMNDLHVSQLDNQPDNPMEMEPMSLRDLDVPASDGNIKGRHWDNGPWYRKHFKHR